MKCFDRYNNPGSYQTHPSLSETNQKINDDDDFLVNAIDCISLALLSKVTNQFNTVMASTSCVSKKILSVALLEVASLATYLVVIAEIVLRLFLTILSLPTIPFIDIDIVDFLSGSLLKTVVQLVNIPITMIRIGLSNKNVDANQSSRDLTFEF